MKIFQVLFWLFISFSSCCDEGHYSITIKNASYKDVVWGIPVDNLKGKYYVDGDTLAKGSSFDYSPFRESIEMKLRGPNQKLTIYFIDPDKFSPNVYCDFDSIAFYNKILKKYEVTQDDLRKLNWTITYYAE